MTNPAPDPGKKKRAFDMRLFAAGLGIGLGVGFGTSNLWLGIGVGVALGAGLALTGAKKPDDSAR